MIKLKLLAFVFRMIILLGIFQSYNCQCSGKLHALSSNNYRIYHIVKFSNMIFPLLNSIDNHSDLPDLYCGNPKRILVNVDKETILKISLDKHKDIILNGSGGGMNYFPDMPIQIIERTFANGLYSMSTLITTGHYTILANKAHARKRVAFNMKNQKKLMNVLEPGPVGSCDNGYAGIAGIHWTTENSSKVLYAFYHAEDQDPLLKKLEANVNGFYASICLAKSYDMGMNFIKMGQVLTSAEKDLNSSAPGHQGDGECSITVDKTGEYLLCYYNDHYGHQIGRGVQICLARAPLVSNGTPGSWKKYYDGAFQTSGLKGIDVTPVVSSSYKGGSAIFPFVIWSEKLDKYIMIYCENVYQEFKFGVPSNSGIYIAFSDDGIIWTGRRKLVTAYTIPFKGREIVIHPTLVITKNSKNGISGHLYYSYSPCWDDPPHFLAGRKIRIEII